MKRYTRHEALPIFASYLSWCDQRVYTIVSVLLGKSGQALSLQGRMCCSFRPFQSDGTLICFVLFDFALKIVFKVPFGCVLVHGRKVVLQGSRCTPQLRFERSRAIH